ncbi:hypothetical protein HB364_12095 [Pseudoflavitalea sp. X16]|uniref:hypothetical protein n=1 Tax=Paraflavitalea devenefica TaxID=2716334 RepID=UPI0014206BEE|nr:hypothetical protein [Paraflavitalea devenefica]NII25830.1 hypothetical protein [Paraflavitalea devenefica]
MGFYALEWMVVGEGLVLLGFYYAGVADFFVSPCFLYLRYRLLCFGVDEEGQAYCGLLGLFGKGFVVCGLKGIIALLRADWGWGSGVA